MDISIIVCTYNPESEIFKRVLAAISKLEIHELQCELILVDNASRKSVFSEYAFEIDSVPLSLKKINESKSGLTNARIAGFNASEGEILIFFDDDNEPDCDYLEKTHSAFMAFPNVGVFGPGNIFVEFLGNPPSWINYNKIYFQERHYERANYACTDKWFDFFPPGTGQSMRRSVFDRYLNCVLDGTLSASDRTGNSMSSAGDVQLVFEAIKSGFAVGIHPEMNLRHLIAERKSSFSYLKRLIFGMSSSYPEAYAESYPHTRKVLPYYTNWAILNTLWSAFVIRIIKKRSFKAFIFLISEQMGKIYGSNLARGENTKSFWFKLIPLLKLK